MRAPLKYLAPLFLVPFLACTDTPVEPEQEETASFKAEKPPKDYGDWLVVDVQCSGPHSGCLAHVTDDWGFSHGFDCKNYTSTLCDSYPPYMDLTITSPGYFWWSLYGYDEGGKVCSASNSTSISVLDSGPTTRYCVGGDNIVVKATFTRVTND